MDGSAGNDAAPSADSSTQGDAAVSDELTCYQFLARGNDLKSPFAVGVASDKYYDVRFAAPWEGTVYAKVIRPIINNSKVIHHWLLYQDGSTGAPTGAVAGSGVHANAQILAGWAPGAEPTDLTKQNVDVGIELPATSYTVEFHYNSTDSSATDASGVEICVVKTKPANVAGMSWLGYDNWKVAGATGNPLSTWRGTCKPTSQQPIHILSVWPHMHLQGVHMKGTINRADGSKEILHDEPFAFEYQRIYEKNVTLQPGESILTECTYKQPMLFGQKTTDEMCYLFTLAYPKGALADGKSYGSIAHGGGACLGQ
jgi:hypothetical protein